MGYRSICFNSIDKVLWTIEGRIYRGVDDQVDVVPMMFNPKYFYDIYVIQRDRFKKLQEDLYG